MRSLITGAAGQDGTILATLLERDGHQVYGLVKPGTDARHLLRYAPHLSLVECDLADAQSLRAAVREVTPDQIFNFGGFTAPGESWTHEAEVWAINVEAVEVMLAEAARLENSPRFFQASSSHIFEGTDRSPQSEDFELSPHSPYAKSKAAALQAVRRVREAGQLFAISAVLYNHESPLRSDAFVTRKVSKAVARISVGEQQGLELGDIEVARDWGWAPDYVRGIRMMLEAPTPQDYVLATGISHRLSFFVQKAFAAVGISDWRAYVTTAMSDRPVDTNKMVGDARSAVVNLGWRHTVDFDSIAQRMVAHDVALLGDAELLWTDF